MKLSRHTIMASVMLASGLVFTLFGDAHAQRAVYRTVSGHGYGCPCPTDCPSDDGEAAADEGMGEEMGEDLPEVADLSSDAAVASASQSAAPNAIGDSLYPGFNVSFGDNLLLGEPGFATLTPGGGRRFKATHNDSPIPQTRVFFNYNYFDNAYIATEAGGGDGVQEVNGQQYEFGAEYAIWCDMASIQVRVPLNYGFASDLENEFPLETDTEFGNVQLALKAVLCQDCCTTYTAGLGFDLPTADDIVVEDVGGEDFTIANETVYLSPYLAMLRSLNCCAFVQGFAQVAIPVNETEISLGDESDDIQEPTLLYLDLSTGYWLHQDCCGNGIVAIGELHYTNALDDDNATVGLEDVAIGDYEFLNATLGVTVVRDCWTLTPAVVLPLLDDTDRQFDYEIAVQVNRRF